VSGHAWFSDGVGRRRQLAGLGLAAALLPALTAILTTVRAQLSLTDDLLVYLVAVLAVTCLGGLWPALAAALAAALCLNWFFTPPLHTWTIDSPQNVVAVALFVAVAAMMSAVVHLAARQSAASRRSASEAQELVALARTVLSGADELDEVLAHLRRSTGAWAALEERQDGQWVPLTPGHPDGRGGAVVEIRPGLRLALGDSAVLAPTLLEGYGAQAAAALDRGRLRAHAAALQAVAEGDRMRTALLAAVSHDLRTPLAAVKAGVSSLRQTDVEWSPADRADLLLTIQEGADRLDDIIANLLDMSRVHTGTLQPLLRPTGVDEVLPLALAGLDRSRVRVDVAEDLPLVVADPGLLERVLANLLANAVRFSPADRAVQVSAHLRDGSLAVDVVDHGPGVPAELQAEMFEPFQQLGDRRQGGVGLGLAVARGFAEAMQGRLSAGATPGGGLTMTVFLPLASPAAPA
jgi:two-component system sensor histidine kinase KdpD